MTPKHPSRRDVLKTAAALTAFGPIGTGGVARAQNAKGPSLTQLDAALRASIEAQDAPGLVAIAATDKGIMYESVLGVRELGKATAMTRDTVFRIASMTKALTSTAAMQLVEQGKLKLNEPVPAIDPALANPQVLTG